MKKTLLLSICLILSSAVIYGQYNSNRVKYWAFGYHGGINWLSGTPTAVSTSISTLEGCSAVCDPSGSLLFYSDGTNVYDRTGTVMPHGTSIVSYSGAWDAAQGSQIVPVPGNPSQYYIFTGDVYSLGDMAHTLVDMTLNSGYGDVVTGYSGIAMGTAFAEKMTCVGGNNCDIWVIVHRRDSAVFWAYDVTSAGISAPVISSVGTLTHNYAGVIKVSPNRLKLALQNGEGTSAYWGTELYDFNPTTGVVSNCQVLNSGGSSNQYGAEFSPDNTKLYTSTLDGTSVYQYDVSLSTTSAIVASKTLVGTTSGAGDFKLGPDNKIYITKNGYSALDCITNPNNSGTSCGYSSGAFTLYSGTHGELGLPNIVFNINPTDTNYISHDTVTCALPGGSATIFAHDSLTGSTYLWNDGVTTTSGMSISLSGTYWVKIYNGCGLTIDTIHVSFYPSVGLITGTGYLCTGAATTLSDTSSGGIWSCSSSSATVGSATGTVTGVSTGLANITYTLPTGCYVTTLVTINPIPPPPAGTPAVCAGVTTTLSDSISGGTWVSGSSAATIGSITGIVTGVSGGTSIITYTLPTGCKSTLTVTVKPLPAAITGTVNVCSGYTTLLSDATGGGVWSTGSSLVATIVPGTGLVTGVTPGSTTIYYTLPSGCSVSAIVYVNALPGTISGLAALCMGASVTLTDGGSGTWTTASPCITLGSSTGLVTGVSAGTALITYTLSTGCFVSTSVTINPNPLPVSGTAVLCNGDTTHLYDGSPGGVWYSDNPAIAGITSLTGVVSGYSGGLTTITYSLSTGCITTYPVTINPTPDPVSGLTSICAGISTTLSEVMTGGSWSSSDATIAPIAAASGVYTGISAGFAILTYTMSTGCYVATPVTINETPGPISGATTVCVGLSTLLSDTVSGGIWSSSSLFYATAASLTGMITGVSTGSLYIFYTLPDGCAASVMVTVNAGASPIAGPAQVCLNRTIALTDATTGGTWSSSNPSTATIGSYSGIVTGLITGSALITYSVGAGCFSTSVITVNPLPAIISGAPLVCAGSSVTLSDPSPGGAWSSSFPTIGSISTSGVLSGIASGNTVIDFTLTATGCSRSVTATVNPQPALIGGVSSVCLGSAITLTDATAGGSWSAGMGSVSVGSSTGIVTGTATGLANVTYSLPTGCTRMKTVTVNPLPGAISGPASLCQGSAALLTDAGGGIWSALSSVANIGSSTGLITGVSAGTALITYTLITGCYVTHTETVNPLPAAIGGPSALCVGTTITLTDAGGGTWGSLTPTVATVGTSTGVVSGLITGTTTVTYSLPSGCTTTGVVTVSTTPTAITGSSTVCAGSSTALTDAVAGGLWSSTNPAVASVGSLSGIVTGSTVGVTIISYSLGSGCTVAKTVTVTASPSAISGSSSICISGTAPMTDATTGGAWTISPVTTGTISSTGVVTGLAAGSATIDYTATGCAATKLITVNTAPAPIAGSGTVCSGSVTAETDAVAGGTWSTSGSALSAGSGTGVVSGVSSGSGTLTYSIGSCIVTKTITVNPVPSISGPTGICTGSTGTLSASISGGIWGGGALAVATVNATTGHLTGIAPGSSTITYTLTTGCSASVVVTVNGTPGSISGTLHVCGGSTTTLSDGTGGGIWSISPATTATIGSSTGLVTAVLTGTAIVTYSLGTGCTVMAIVTVSAVPAAISGIAQVCAGLTTTLSEITTGGTWSAGSGTASVSGTGLVTGVSAGFATISYTVSGCSATYPVTVNPLPSAISGTSSLCAGLTSPFTDVSPGGTWSIAPVSVATVGSAGSVLGVSPGTATITYTLATGCTTLKTIIVNSAPAAIAGNTIVCIGSVTALTDGTIGGAWSSSVPSVASVGSTGVVTGISIGATVISYIVGGCPAVKPVTVNSLPAAITGPVIVCISATVTAADAGGGAWSSSNPVIASIGSSSGIITGVAAGTAVITYSMGIGCTVTEMITVNPLPAAITSSSANVCVGLTLPLADATPGGVWGSGSPAVAAVSTTGVVTGISGGVSIITYTAPSGCMVTKAITVISVAPVSGVHNVCAYGDTMTVSDVPATGLYISSLATITNLGGGLGLVTGHTPGSASVTYILPSGCTATAFFTVNPLPVAIAGSGHICSGSTAAFTDATPGGTWSTSATGILTVGSSSGIVTGIAGGTGYVTYTLPATGCKADTTELVYTMPAAITGAASLFLGTPITLSDVLTGGSWSSSNTVVATIAAGTGHVTGISVGAVTITYVTGGGCYVTKNLMVMPTAGRSGPLENGETEKVREQGVVVRVSPNPGDGGFVIDISWNAEETVHITISNVAGMKIKDWSIVTAKDETVSVPVKLDVASGVYLLSIEGRDYRYVSKVLVEK